LDGRDRRITDLQTTWATEQELLKKLFYSCIDIKMNISRLDLLLCIHCYYSNSPSDFKGKVLKEYISVSV
jgi:hypothetical protein